MWSSIAPVFALAGAASALSALDIQHLLSNLGPAPDTDPRFTNWVPPGPGDLRSPCPGLNTAANHGFINHNGRDITIPDLVTGLAAGMSMGADFSVAIGGAGLLSSPNPFGGSFTLADLDQHNFPIEHDASISRQDAYFGNDYSFYKPNFDSYIDYFGKNTTTSLKGIADAKNIRYRNSLETNPTFTFGAREFAFSFGENALYAQFLSNPASLEARLDYVRMFFEQEKLPYELGWRPSVAPITLVSLGAAVVELYAATPEPLQEGEVIVTDTIFKDTLEVLVGGSEVLNNLTQGISGALGL